jgi:hypothetical protein
MLTLLQVYGYELNTMSLSVLTGLMEKQKKKQKSNADMKSRKNYLISSDR